MRNFKITLVSSISIEERAYKALTRPAVEFASCMWDPYTKKGIANVESYHNVRGVYRNTSSVGEMLTSLSWHSLQSRRKSAKLYTMYKTAHKLVHNNNRCLKPPNRRTCQVSSALPDFPNPSPQKQLQEILLLPSDLCWLCDWNALPENAVTVLIQPGDLHDLGWCHFSPPSPRENPPVGGGPPPPLHTNTSQLRTYFIFIFVLH